MPADLSHFAIVSGIVFVLGASGYIFKRDNLIAALMMVQLMLLGGIVSVAAFATALNDVSGYALVALAVIAGAGHAVAAFFIHVAVKENKEAIAAEEEDALLG
ncbi:MAG: NADH-quinone oxidoreductase subunit K [Pseudomonadota bacterium]